MSEVFPKHIRGECPICDKAIDFVAWGADYRNQFICPECHTVPRERALMLVLKRLFPNWRAMSVHESSPAERGVSTLLKRECAEYVASQFYPGAPLGEIKDGFRNENLEASTFPDARFDLVVTQDVMEHVNDITLALKDILRTLKPGGAHIFTTPTYMAHQTIQWATYRNGAIEWFYEPEYHGNPVDEGGSAVTFHYGYDLPELIHKWTGAGTEVIRFCDLKSGIAGPMTEVYVTRKPAS